MKFIDNTWRVIAENERLQLSKTEGQVRCKGQLLKTSISFLRHPRDAHRRRRCHEILFSDHIAIIN